MGKLQNFKEEFSKLSLTQIIVQIICGFALATVLFWAIYPLLKP